MLEERGVVSGSASGHYFHEDLLVARRIHKRNLRRYIDVGSRIDGFVAHVASFREKAACLRCTGRCALPHRLHRTAARPAHNLYLAIN